jgi:hypothetical protein
MQLTIKLWKEAIHYTPSIGFLGNKYFSLAEYFYVAGS